MKSDNTPSIDRIAELQRLITKLTEISRMVPYDTSRFENYAEHSYSLAMICWFLAPQVAPELSLEKILRYAIAHDVVEVYSGDTYVFDVEGQKTKSSREDAAIKRLSKEWPDFIQLTDAARDYKAKRDAEAKFVYTIDKLLPPIITKSGNDEEFFRRNKITRSMHESEKNKKMQYSPEALPYLHMLNAWMLEDDTFYEP